MLKIYNTYIHIPFCERKCNYCDFTSLSGTDKKINEYVEYLIREINIYKEKLNINDYQKTIYFGGGTPSLLSIENLSKILSEFKFNRDTEITIEVNPKTVDKKKLKDYLNLGINRLSIGIQTFNEERLKVLGRIHNVDEAVDTFNAAREVGFNNISIDLMFALPKQTLDDLKYDLEKVIELNPEHISIYSLIWEEGTKFYKDLKAGKLKEADNDLEATMYEYIINFLKSKNYNHYEISNFSKKGLEAKHNSIYWKNKNYLGLGLSAAGYLENIRYKNFFNLKYYYNSLDKNLLPIEEEEKLTVEEVEEYKYIVGFRLLNEEVIPNEKYLPKCESLVETGYFLKKDKGYILTHKGLMFFNDIMENFIE